MTPRPLSMIDAAQHLLDAAFDHGVRELFCAEVDPPGCWVLLIRGGVIEIQSPPPDVLTAQRIHCEFVAPALAKLAPMHRPDEAFPEPDALERMAAGSLWCVLRRDPGLLA